MNYEERFRSKYAVDNTTGCWEWQGSKDAEGYGVFWDTAHGNNRRAHRVSMELNGTPIPKHLQTLHQCDNKGCVNPQHLKAGTNRENQLEAVARGQHGDVTNKRKQKILAMSETEFGEWLTKFNGKTGRALANRNTAMKWRIA